MEANRRWILVEKSDEIIQLLKIVRPGKKAGGALKPLLNVYKKASRIFLWPSVVHSGIVNK